MSRGAWWCVVTLGIVVASATGAEARWVTQDLELQPGWNAVYLEVEPMPAAPAESLSGVPVRTLWAWNPSVETIQYIQDPETLLPGQPNWLVYSADGSAGVSNLFALRGGRAYLLYLDGTSPVTWHVTGVPVPPTERWLPNSYHLTGFPVATASAPTFATYFAASASHTPITVYRLIRTAVSATWEKVANPASTPIVRGEAYWVLTRAYSEYAGALSVTPAEGGALDYGRMLEERRIQIRNASANASQVALTLKSAAAAPGSEPAAAGGVQLEYWTGEVPGAWVSLADGLTVPVPAGGTAELRVAVRRANMPGAEYESVLELRGISGGAAGQRIALPVLARGRAAVASGARGVGHARAGLWVGTAAVTHVSHPLGGQTVPTKAAAEFGVRLLVHVDASGKAQLLDHVTLMWRDGTTKPDPDNPGKEIVATPGRFVLVANDALLDQFKGAAVRDGKQVGRRFSTAAFSQPTPVALTGSFDGTLQGQLVLDYDDPVNPFRHVYHPDHDNLDGRFENLLEEGVESYTITRDLTLSFKATDPEGLQLAGFGDTRVAGEYEEKIQGLHHDLIHVKGTFRLAHVSRVAVLDDGL